MLVDCFPFFNDFDLLEIRLNSLAPYVDRFILVESPINQRGKPKPLFFNDNKDRFSQFNIIYISTDDFIGRTTWETTDYQFEYMAENAKFGDGEDIVLFSAMDEIPNLEIYEVGKEGVFCCQMYYYYLNYRVKASNAWRGTMAVKRKNISSFKWLREKGRRRLPHFVPTDSSYQCGWHFSVVGSVEQFMLKYDSHSHRETDDPAMRQQVQENREKLRDPWYGVWTNHSTRVRKMWIEMPKGPRWLLENKDRYKHLFLKGETDEQ